MLKLHTQEKRRQDKHVFSSLFISRSLPDLHDIGQVFARSSQNELKSKYCSKIVFSLNEQFHVKQHFSIKINLISVRKQSCSRGNDRLRHFNLQKS